MPRLPRPGRRAARQWMPSNDDTPDAYEARLLRVLLVSVRALPGCFPSHAHDDLAVALGWLINRLSPAHLKLLTDAMRAQAKADGRYLGDGEDDLAEDTTTSALMAGKVLAQGVGPVRTVLAALEAELDAYLADLSAPTDSNVGLLAQMLGLDAPEQALLSYAVAVTHSVRDRTILAFVPFGHRMSRAMGAVLGISPQQAQRVMGHDSRLAHSGLFENLASPNPHTTLDDLLMLGLLGRLLMGAPYSNTSEMARAVLKALPAPRQRLTWPHLAAEQQVVTDMLRTALEQRCTGINILLHGAPGTGKTEFASHLVQDVGATGYLVDHEDSQCGEARRSERLFSLRLSQNLAGQDEQAVLVLDEAEDIFTSRHDDPLSRSLGRQRESKAWTNKMLEENTHPVIWISNDVSGLDPAYLRRFTICLEFPAMPLTLRRELVQSLLAPLGCSADVVRAVAADELNTPALVASAARFAALAGAAGHSADQTALMHVRQHAQAAGRSQTATVAPRTQRFDLRYLNLADRMTPQQLITALRHEPSAALMFSGPPGSGKTQLAAELASQLGLELVVRTASDITSKWYGESEANVARLFRGCDPKAELLFVDEADVLLSERGGGDAHHVDRAVTAEFLRWLECFEGVFICATNFAGALDEALMRRFTFRVRFEPMTLAQREAMYAEHVLGWDPDSGGEPPALPADAQRRLQALTQLTPGDFANAGRRVRRLGLGADAWLDELEDEHAAKRGQGLRVRMGFV